MNYSERSRVVAGLASLLTLFHHASIDHKTWYTEGRIQEKQEGGQEGSGERKSPSGVYGQSPGKGLRTKSPEAE